MSRLHALVADGAAYPEFLAAGRGRCATWPWPDDFTEDGTRTAWQHRARARAVNACHDCPFMLACRTWARRTGQRGVWGGETTAERDKQRQCPR